MQPERTDEYLYTCRKNITKSYSTWVYQQGFFFWPGPLELIHILIIFKKIIKYIFQGKLFFFTEIIFINFWGVALHFLKPELTLLCLKKDTMTFCLQSCLSFMFYIFIRLIGIVHPKMKILSLITHPHVVPNPLRPLFIFRTQIKIFLMKSESFLTLHWQQRNYHVQET